MDCQNVRLLLAFAQRPAERVDAEEHEAIQQHLAQCSECAGLAQAELACDAVLGSAVRAIPIPAGLRERILTQVAKQRRPIPFLLPGAAAAILILALGAGSLAYCYHRPSTTFDDASGYFAKETAQATPADVKQWFAEQGVTMDAPGFFDYQYLRSYDLVEFKRRRIPRLDFNNLGHGGVQACARVYVLSDRQFQMGDFPEERMNGIECRRQDGFVYVILFQGDVQRLLLNAY